MYVYLFGCAMFNFGFTVMLTQRLVLRLRRASRQDALTGLDNRGAIDAELRRRWAPGCAAPAGPSVMLIDVDHFKRINDAHGHAAGDRVLAQVAAVIAAAIGEAARVGRYGGEEFLVVMARGDAGELRVRAERLRAAVAAEPIQARGESLHVTLSIGLATALAEDASAEALISRADRALYRAKAAGRNRVEIDDAEGPVPVPHAAG
jgi:diguanylate cyclase (GGDEF)-like protein